MVHKTNIEPVPDTLRNTYGYAERRPPELIWNTGHSFSFSIHSYVATLLQMSQLHQKNQLIDKTVGPPPRPNRRRLSHPSFRRPSDRFEADQQQEQEIMD